MRQSLKRIAVVVVMVLVSGIFGQPTYAADNNVQADSLHSLGLFQGTNNGYELDRQVTRAQAAVMLVRLLGAENQARNGNYSHPFTDVPSWAEDAIAYMYSSNFTQGASHDKFNPGGLCSLQMYTTFVMRALGYGNEFSYQSAIVAADELGLLSSITKNGNFLRGDMVAVSYSALAVKLKGSDRTLLDELVADKVVDVEAAQPVQKLFAAETGDENIMSAHPDGTDVQKIKLTAGNIVLTATMLDNAASRDFISQLPLTLTLQEYAGTEKISDLPSKLSTEGTPAGIDPSVGNITYYAPWGNLAIFYEDFGYSSGLIQLGSIDSGIEALAGMKEDFTVTIERMD
ncbi:cyclophilin-like fold protein [Paenibacillus sp. IHBB 3054]|uniref:cyclophilin-like fold protein n=1 Tax=Paenibacillus sp. IHBB 3054 TaxID=3425689 RepID=UPI003F6695FD